MAQHCSGRGRDGCLKEKWVNSRHALGGPLDLLSDGFDRSKDWRLSPGLT